MGDVIAAAPVVKYAIEHFHKEADYHVLVKPYYFDLFNYFIPTAKMGDQGKPWSYSVPWQVRYLNTPRSTNARITSMHMHLSTFASIQLLNRIIPDEHLYYLPLPEVDISHFDIDFSNAVIIVVTYRDEVRKIPFELVKGVSEWAADCGFTPVYVGRIDNSEVWKDSPFKLSFDMLPTSGVDLLNKTSVLELATIIGRSRVVVGMDSGPIHVAGTTKTPIVCGFTNVTPEHRIPIRKEGAFIPVVSDLPCSHCQSRWSLNYYDFGFCYFKHYDCIKQMTSEKFIRALERILFC